QNRSMPKRFIKASKDKQSFVSLSKRLAAATEQLQLGLPVENKISVAESSRVKTGLLSSGSGKSVGRVDSTTSEIARKKLLSSLSLFRSFELSSEQKVDPEEVQKLLKLVVEGEQDQAEAMVKENSALLLVKGEVTDLSERTFKNITAFQYALWALDWHMWKMLASYMPDKYQWNQILELDKNGTEHGKYFTLKPLITALEDYIENNEYSVWRNDKDRQSYWQRNVGGEQRKLPVHVVHEYCRKDRSFRPLPLFTEATLPRTRQTQDGGEWFTSSHNEGTIGVGHANVRAGYNEATWQASDSTCKFPHMEDKGALKKLYSTRVKQLKALRWELKEKLELELEPEPEQSECYFAPK
ncbi:MAG: hypothetical protein K0U12_02790, partial [Gammaproteobacteria bacterium]|nr:hypothetical protein [Gammaproteobacteria bacterium]